MNYSSVDDLVFKEATIAAVNAFDTKAWAAELGIDIVANQVEIIDTISKKECTHITILASRSAGKTFSVCLAAIKMCLDIPGYKVIVFGPRIDQASRIVQEIGKMCKRSYLKGEVEWNAVSRTKFLFKNTSEILALSANEMSETEGWHGDMCIIDEAHRVSDSSFRKRIAPMFKSSRRPKFIKIGISMYRNHFYESCHSSKWTNLVYPWNKCPWLYGLGVTNVSGIDYPNAILEDMPLAYKKMRFPNNPELHYDSINGVIEEDFDTQYEMKWIENVNLFLRSEDQDKLIGYHGIRYEGVAGEVYFFGLDLAGGSEIEKSNKRDMSSLTIVRKSIDNVKEIVFAQEWQGDVTEQMSDILNLVHPDYGKFKCVGGCADYGSLGAGVVDYFKKIKLPIMGIRFKSTESTTGKNYKNAIFDQFIFELRNERIKYPIQDQININPVFQRHQQEWYALERRKQLGINDYIGAPSTGGFHDDTSCSSALSIWAADRYETEQKGTDKTSPFKYKFPNLVIGPTSYVSKASGEIRQGNSRSIFEWDKPNK